MPLIWKQVLTGQGMHQSNIWKESKTPFSALVLPQEPKLKSVWSSRLAPKWPTHTDNRFPFCKEDKEPKQILPFKEVPFEWSHRTEFCPQTQTLQHIRFFPAANSGHFSERSGALLSGNSILYCCVSCKKWRIQGGGAPPLIFRPNWGHSRPCRFSAIY